MAAKNRLSAGFIRTAPVGKHCDGAGLWLIKRKDGGAQWMQRVTVHGKRREMGLGGFPTHGLADARKLSERWRSMAAAGRDPIKERESEERAANRKDISLEIITQDGPVTFLCRSKFSFRPPSARRRPDFSSRVLNGGVVDCRSR